MFYSQTPLLLKFIVAEHSFTKAVNQDLTWEELHVTYFFS